MQKKYKFIFMEKSLVSENGYVVKNNKTKKPLGYIGYYLPWKKYIFDPTYASIFSTSCLKDIVDFMEQIPKPGTANETNSTQSTS